MSPAVRRRVAAEPADLVVCDYIAGMTDRFARQEHERLFPADRRV